jgi:surface antigen
METGSKNLMRIIVSQVLVANRLSAATADANQENIPATASATVDNTARNMRILLALLMVMLSQAASTCLDVQGKRHAAEITSAAEAKIRKTVLVIVASKDRSAAMEGAT